jgi:replicative DNA helicase
MGATHIGLPINSILYPDRIDDPKIIEQRELAVEHLQSLSKDFMIIGSDMTRSIEDMERQVQIYKYLAEDKQLVVFIDSLHCISTYKKMETRETFMYISDKLKKWSNTYDIPVVCVSELRKIEDKAKPTLQDLKEAVDLGYDATCSMAIWSEMHATRNAATQKSFTGPDGVQYPIFELMVLKNKTSSFKGSLFYKFYTNTNKVEECSAEEHRQFWSLR